MKLTKKYYTNDRLVADKFDNKSDLSSTYHDCGVVISARIIMQKMRSKTFYFVRITESDILTKYREHNYYVTRFMLAAWLFSIVEIEMRKFKLTMRTNYDTNSPQKMS